MLISPAAHVLAERMEGGMRASKTNLLAGTVLLLVGVVQLLRNHHLLGYGGLIVGALLIAQYFWLKRNRDID